jgi:hypothetical protein
MTRTKGSVSSALTKLPMPKGSRPSGQRLYLAGPIRGVRDFEDRFRHASALLRHAGFRVFNPVEQDAAFTLHGVPISIRNCLELDLVWICRWADIVALLGGWQTSSGAMAEYYTARAIGVDTWELPREYLLD